MSPIQGEISHRKHDPREMLLLSGGRLFQDVGYVQASIHRIASAVNAPKGTFYNYFKSKEELASRLVDRQFEALRESLSRPTDSASDQLREHCHFLAAEPPMVEVAPLQLLATLAAEAPAIPAALTQHIARGTGIWITRVSDLISRVQIESGTATGRDDPQKLASLLVTCWYGAIIRRKTEPSLKPLDEFLPFFVRGGVF
jgi:TetR/AcrR family transcriptional repressor of nem operon